MWYILHLWKTHRKKKFRKQTQRFKVFFVVVLFSFVYIYLGFKMYLYASVNMFLINKYVFVHPDIYGIQTSVFL